jgi:hypothetical protein
MAAALAYAAEHHRAVREQMTCFITCLAVGAVTLAASVHPCPSWNHTVLQIQSLADNQMRKAETCRLFELAPTPRLFVCPITAILGKSPWSVLGTQALFSSACKGMSRHFIQEEGVIWQLIRGRQLVVIRQHLGYEMVAEGMKVGLQQQHNTRLLITCIYTCLHETGNDTAHYISLQYITCNCTTFNCV